MNNGYTSDFKTDYTEKTSAEPGGGKKDWTTKDTKGHEGHEGHERHERTRKGHEGHERDTKDTKGTRKARKTRKGRKDTKGTSFDYAQCAPLRMADGDEICEKMSTDWGDGRLY